MSDATFRFGAVDAATPTIRKVKREVDLLGASAARTGQSLQRIGAGTGGAAGGALGRAGGALAAGGLVGGIALGGMAAMAVLSAIRAASERQVQIATQQLQFSQRMEQIQQQAARARESVAAGGLSLARQAQQLRSVGGRGMARDLAESGVGIQEAIQAAIDAQLSPGTISNPQFTSQVARLSQTGLLSASEAVKELKLGMTPTSIIRRRLGPNGTDQQANAVLLSAPGRQNVEGRLPPIEAAVAESNRLTNAQFGDLMNRRTEIAVRNATNDALDGGSGRAIQELRREVRNTANLLYAAADAQSAMGRVLDEAGAVFSGGSKSQRAADFLRASEIVGE
jgi:hypothetical protein